MMLHAVIDRSKPSKATSADPSNRSAPLMFLPSVQGPVDLDRDQDLKPRDNRGRFLQCHGDVIRQRHTLLGGVRCVHQACVV